MSTKPWSGHFKGGHSTEVFPPVSKVMGYDEKYIQGDGVVGVEEEGLQLNL